MFVLSMTPTKQTKNVDLVLVPQEVHCPASAESLCFCVPQYLLKLQLQIGRSCKKKTRLAVNIPEPLQLVPSDASFSGKEKWIP